MHLLRDWWAQIWPNLIATPLTAGPMFLWHHRRIKAHITATAEQPAPPAPSTVDIRVAGGTVDKELRNAIRTRRDGLR